MDDHDVGAVAGEQTIDDALRKIVGAECLSPAIMIRIPAF